MDDLKMAKEPRLIDADALLESKWWDSLKDDFDKARAKIIVQSCPTVDATPVVHGRWNYDGSCGICGVHVLSNYMNYCPNCGADMRERKE